MSALNLQDSMGRSGQHVLEGKYRPQAGERIDTTKIASSLCPDLRPMHAPLSDKVSRRETGFCFQKKKGKRGITFSFKSW